MVNIYEIIIVDIFYQLIKGIVIYLINWIKQLLKENMPAARKRKGVSKTIIKASGLNRLNKRFRIVFPFTGLKTFPSFAEVKQWTGVE